MLTWSFVPVSCSRQFGKGLLASSETEIDVSEWAGECMESLEPAHDFLVCLV